MENKEVIDQLNMLVGAIEKLADNMLTKEDIEPITDRVANKAAALINQKLGKRIDGLVDGYKATHEKQWELERRVDEMEQQLQDILTRIS